MPQMSHYKLSASLTFFVDFFIILKISANIYDLSIFYVQRFTEAMVKLRNCEIVEMGNRKMVSFWLADKKIK